MSGPDLFIQREILNADAIARADSNESLRSRTARPFASTVQLLSHLNFDEPSPSLTGRNFFNKELYPETTAAEKLPVGQPSARENLLKRVKGPGGRGQRFADRCFQVGVDLVNEENELVWK